jgi:hypothetical protein
MCWSFLPHVRFLILLTVFELLPKTCNFTICSIFCNSGYVGWCTASPDTILKLDTLVMIQTKFGFHWSSTFRGEDFWKSLRRTTTTDAKWWVRWAKNYIEMMESTGSMTVYCHWKSMESWEGTKNLGLCSGDNELTLLWNLQMRSLVCKELSKHVTHYGQWSGFPYYNLTTPILRGIPLSTTQGCTEQLCGFEPWEPSPEQWI